VEGIYIESLEDIACLHKFDGCVQAELRASSSNVSRLPYEHSAVNNKAVSMDIGQESATDAQYCVQGVQLMKLEQSRVEVNQHAELSAHSVLPLNSGPARAAGIASDVVVEELNATMNHIIDTSCYPFTSEPDDDQLNASIMIDPSNPLDEGMIERMLSKLEPPLSCYENYRRVNANIPKICARGSVQLGVFCILFC